MNYLLARINLNLLNDEQNKTFNNPLQFCIYLINTRIYLIVKQNSEYVL